MPVPAWYEADADDADRYPTTPHTGHPGADLSDADGRNPLEPTNDYIRRLTTMLKAERDENARLTAIVKPCFCGGEHHA